MKESSNSEHKWDKRTALGVFFFCTLIFILEYDCFKPRDLIIDMDSTYHELFGEKIEGVAWNYKNEWSIETQVAFSNLGFCHGVQMRPGNTKSGTDAASAIERIFQDARSQLKRT